MTLATPSHDQDHMEVQTRCVDEEMSLLVNDRLWIVADMRRGLQDDNAEGGADANDLSEENVRPVPKSDEAEESAERTAELKNRREKEVLFLRHKLQKTLLGRDQEPKSEEMEMASAYYGQLESLPSLETSILRITKIHKVMKAVLRLESIPREDEFNFRARSQALLEKWKDALAVPPTAYS